MIVDDEQRLKIAVELFAEIKRRLGPLVSELQIEDPPDFTTLGPDWEAQYAAWWANLLNQASALLPDDRQFAEMAAQWSMMAQEGTLPMDRHAGKLMDRSPTLDDLQKLLTKQ